MRLVIADDHAIVRRGIELLLSPHSDIEVVGSAADGQQALSLVAAQKPDVILLDISMPPGDNGLLMISRILEASPDTKIIIFTMHDDEAYLLYTLQRGVRGYLLKNAAEDELVSALYQVYRGGVYISAELMPYIVQKGEQLSTEDNALLQLTDREIEILILIAGGFGNKEIAAKLFLSVKTVESYKSKIMHKLGATTRHELTLFALRKKLLS